MEESLDVIQSAFQVRDNLCKKINFSKNPIDLSIPHIPKPYKGNGKIKLIIIGQDPTIRNKESRPKVKTVLNLDKQDALEKYIKNEICGGLGIDPEEFYATNLFKYFYSEPPKDTEFVLWAHLEPNLTLLKKEIAQYPNCPIITLGDPVFKLLSGNPKKRLNKLWGYQSQDKPSTGHFQMEYIEHFGRYIYPLPHLPSWQKIAFYKNTLKDYLKFMKQNNPILQ